MVKVNENRNGKSSKLVKSLAAAGVVGTALMASSEDANAQRELATYFDTARAGDHYSVNDVDADSNDVGDTLSLPNFTGDDLQTILDDNQSTSTRQIFHL